MHSYNINEVPILSKPPDYNIFIFYRFIIEIHNKIDIIIIQYKLILYIV